MMLKLLSFLLLPRHAGDAPAPAAAAEPAADAERCFGCGWFDSSHDLHAGLLVQEHATPDAVARELPLAGWLQLQGA